MRSILYISRISPEIASDHNALSAIVQAAKSWNAQVGITGALIITDLHFVQQIEGPSARIAELLDKLRADKRHSDITVIEDTVARERWFPRWSLAYSGPDTFIDQQLLPILKAPGGPARRDLAYRLITRLRAMADNEILETGMLI